MYTLGICLTVCYQFPALCVVCGALFPYFFCLALCTVLEYLLTHVLCISLCLAFLLCLTFALLLLCPTLPGALFIHNYITLEVALHITCMVYYMYICGPQR